MIVIALLIFFWIGLVALSAGEISVALLCLTLMLSAVGFYATAFIIGFIPVCILWSRTNAIREREQEEKIKRAVREVLSNI